MLRHLLGQNWPTQWNMLSSMNLELRHCRNNHPRYSTDTTEKHWSSSKNYMIDRHMGKILKKLHSHILLL